MLFVFVGCENSPEPEPKTEYQNITGDYQLGQEFSFMSFKVTVGKDYEVATINKELSKDHNKKVIKVPVTVTNTSNEKDHLSMFYYKFYYKDIELESKGSYFDDSLDYAKDLEPNGKYTKYFYIPYDENGQYIIEFNNLSSKYKIVINI
jgi:hypothetical protein